MEFVTEEKAYTNGNAFFVDEDYDSALEQYNEAIELSSEKKAEYFEKRAACFLKLEEFEKSVADCEEASKIDPNRVTVYLKQGNRQALFQMEKYSLSQEIFKKGLEKCENSKTKRKFRNWIRKTKAELAFIPVTEAKKVERKKPKVERVEKEVPPPEEPKEEENDDDVPDLIEKPKPNEEVEKEPEKKEDEEKGEDEKKEKKELKYSREDIEITKDWPDRKKEDVVIEPKNKTRADMVREQFYQMGNKVVLNILKLKGVPNSDRKVVCSNLYDVLVEIKFSDGSFFQKSFHLYKRVQSFKVRNVSMKTEITFDKGSGENWTKWVRDDDRDDTDIVKKYPTSKNVDWHKVDSELSKVKDESNDNAFFSTLFKDATPEQRMAIEKSYRESGGTVLSTNWEDVQKKTVKVSPPEGMEQRRWDGYHEEIEEYQSEDSDSDDDHGHGHDDHHGHHHQSGRGGRKKVYKWKRDEEKKKE